ncbi:hypothetical protein NHE_0101 [Neorickettsia helminthoeca str. Oregon]|uniref:Uncharacterized protein n=1 Tax=Neorickettsia helminthoeca str. Oregon TaxID=1286528 RepID=X5H3E7_9RICK|nr:hypothetical protein NHE_0101 [Neorickettsia helminthoeca str. Oregon]
MDPLLKLVGTVRSAISNSSDRCCIARLHQLLYQVWRNAWVLWP